MSDWSGLACQCESLRDDCYLFGTLYRTHVPYHSGTITEHVCTVGKAFARASIQIRESYATPNPPVS